MQARLENWEATRDQLKMNLARDLYGVGAPLRMMMDRRIVSHVS